MLLTVCLISLLFPLPILATIPMGNRTERTIFNCTAKGGECDESKARAVCGTDNQTYATRCHLIRAQCGGHKVSLKHRGPCKEYYSYTECLKSRAYAIAHRSSSPKKFVPRCRSDGTYAAVQCMGGSGCWCSDGQGKPIPNTTTSGGKPVCPKISKTNIRRSPMRIHQNRGESNRRMCRRPDQRLFNSNLVKVFNSEYIRQHPSEVAAIEKTILDWKFSQLDISNDNQLQKIECKELRRLVRKVIKPKRCARLFGKQLYCDTDRDGQLSRQEWTNCFNNDKLNQLFGQGPGFMGNNFEDEYEEVADEYEDEDDNNGSNSDLASRRIDFGRRQKPFLTPVTPYPPVYRELVDCFIGIIQKCDSTALLLSVLRSKAIVDSDAVLREAETDSDCLSDRAAALDEQKSGVDAIYVPECTVDGRYQRVQCYRSAGYCWCVHEDTGKNIPGTSIKDGRPDCSLNITRPMKGCPEPKKMEFLKELKLFLRIQIANNAANAGANTTHWASEDERVATLSFVLLDKNKNKVWERKEWKTFRELVMAARALKKCGKKMPRYCDVNNDKKITLSEWLNCLQVNGNDAKPKSPDSNPARPTQNTLKLKGPNPLDSYLKSD